VLELVKSALRAQGVWNPALEKRFEEFERVCLKEIRSEPLRTAVLDYLENVAPIEFFTAPASSSGRYHPYWQNALGGILLNTSECCIGIDRKMRIHPDMVDGEGNPKSEDRDIIFVATILSDTFKTEDFGKTWRDFAHHRIAAKRWREVAGRHPLSARTVTTIADAIEWHLGRFTPAWPVGRDPRSLPLHTFITHELDMDFSNRGLAEVFERKEVGAMSAEQLDGFMQKEFDTAADYFKHVETKLSSVVTFYATLLIAVISGSYYISVSDMFQKMSFWVIRTPRAFFIALAALVFFGIGIFFLGMYTELRTRKIRMLEEMAAIRAYYIDAGKRIGKDISSGITMVVGVVRCPQFLRRPSEDWYTLLLMSFVNSCALAVSLTFGLFVVVPNWLKYTTVGKLVVVPAWLLVFAVVFFAQFRWVTVFCFVLDCERELKYGAPQYGLMPKHSSSFPFFLRYLDRLAQWIENRNKQAILNLLREGTHVPGAGTPPAT
jgi:hypothetical protein